MGQEVSDEELAKFEYTRHILIREIEDKNLLIRQQKETAKRMVRMVNQVTDQTQFMAETCKMIHNALQNISKIKIDNDDIKKMKLKFEKIKMRYKEKLQEEEIKSKQIELLTELLAGQENVSSCVSNAQKEQNCLIKTQKSMITMLEVISKDLKRVNVEMPTSLSVAKSGVNVFRTKLLKMNIIFSFLREVLHDLKSLPANINAGQESLDNLVDNSLDIGESFLVCLREVYSLNQIVPEELMTNHTETDYLDNREKLFFDDNANELVQLTKDKTRERAKLKNESTELVSHLRAVLQQIDNLESEHQNVKHLISGELEKRVAKLTDLQDSLKKLIKV